MSTITRNVSAIALLTAVSMGVSRADPPASPAASAAAAFEGAVGQIESIAPSEARGVQPLVPAIPAEKVELAGAAGRALLRQELSTNAAPGGSFVRQAIALAYLANHPTADDAAQVRTLLENKQIWEPWRAALVIGASGDAEQLPTLRSILDEKPEGWAGAQAAMAIGMLGNADGAAVLESFLRLRYGTREYNFGKEALILLGRKGPAQAEAVTQAAISLLTVKEQGMKTIGGLTWRLDHPDRIAYLQSSAIDVLRAVGTTRGAEALQAEMPRLVKASAELIAYANQTVALIRSRGDSNR